MTRTAVLYHDNCPDGWTAAWVAHRALDERGDTPNLIPVSHGSPPPDLHGVETLYIVDFSYHPDVLESLADGGDRRVTVLDHHQTALDEWRRAHDFEPDVTSLDDRHVGTGLHVVLDMDRSGAGITWDWFHPGEPRPPLVDYVEDRDLWRYQLPRSREINSVIRCLHQDLDTWDTAAARSVETMVDMGSNVLLHINAYCRAATSHAYWCQMGDRTFPIVNVTYESCSDVANHMLDHFRCDMAGYFFERGQGGWQYGFRSRNGVTVHDHAAAFGGGGHPQASGCVTERLVHVRTEAP